MTQLSPQLSPVTIHEAIDGTYEKGKWILIAGLENPRDVIDAFKEGKQGMKYWRKIDKLGNIQEVEVNGDKKEYYITAGDDPNSLICHFLRFLEQSQDFETGLEDFEKEYVELKENSDMDLT